MFFTLYHFRRKIFESLLGGILVLSSWEVAYHSRWAMPDTLQIQFAALTMMCVTFALNNKTEKSFQWLSLGTIGAACNCASKYHGGVFLLMTCLATFYLGKKQAIPTVVIFKKIFKLLILFSFSFFLLCPGILLQPLNFFDDLASRIVNYSLGHGGYTVQPFWEHGELLILYLSQVLFSSYSPIALFFFVFSFFGVYTSWKSDRWGTAILLSSPLIFFLYIITNKVMIVRNDLQIVPILAFLSAIGLGELREKISKRFFKISFEVLLGILLFFNIYWLYYTSETIAKSSEIDFIHNIESHLKTHSNQKFFLSHSVFKNLESHYPSNLSQAFPNIVTASQEADSYLFLLFEAFAANENDWVKLKANRQYIYQMVSGTYDVNLTYYPTWAASHKLMVISISQALEMGILQHQ
ncbi:MAG: phospholipid carrier-dependent glycosyltransferase [Planctomycetota bacterium]